MFTLIAIAFAFAILLLPASRHDYREVSAAAVLAAGLLAVTLGWSRYPRVAVLAISIGYIVLAALLRDSAGGSASGFGGLFLLPVLWVAINGGRRELGAVLLAMFLAQYIPVVAIGAPDYPSSGLRAVLVLTSIAALTGLMVQHLVDEARGRAELLEEQAGSLERASARLAEQNERLVELDRQKDEFIAVLSHELRTPLTSISGYLNMALDHDAAIPETERGYLTIVQRNVGRLMALVGQLLFLARAEAHPFELEPEPVDLTLVLQEAGQTARPAAERRNIALQVEASTPPLVLADRALLLQLVDNLVSNAVKFTPAGGKIGLTASRIPGRVVVSVTDTGVGIAADELPALFDRFSRATSATENAVPGVGLGLAICRVIAEAHDTEIEVESRPGRGSTFRFALALADEAATVGS
jgi:signal transduction histidine kinase